MPNTEIPDDQKNNENEVDAASLDGEFVHDNAQYYLKRLSEFFNESHPNDGADTEIGKLELARHALETTWRLRDGIAVWAQAHLVGYCICKGEPELLDFLEYKTGRKINENSHILEALGMLWSPNDGERIEGKYPELDGWLEEWKIETGREDIISTETLRSIISEMMMSRTVNSSFWRTELQNSLLALNKGEISDLTAPVQVKRQGKPYHLNQCRALAIMHVYFRIGKGVKKYRALEEIANALAVSPETLRSWEKNQDFDEDAYNNFYCAKLAGKFEKNMNQSKFIADIKLDPLEFGMHRCVWNIHSAFYMYRDVLNKPLEELRGKFNLYRKK